MAENKKVFVLEKKIKEDYTGATINTGMVDNSRVVIKYCCDIESIKHEERMLRELRHPNIVELYYRENNYLFLREIKKVESLAEWNPRKTKYDIGVCIRMLRELASALKYIHEKGIIHYNVNPYSVLVEHGSCVRLVLCDFELASTNLTRRVGRFEYSAPELDSVIYPITNKVDVYGFRYVMLHVLASGRNTTEYTYFIPIRLVEVMEKCGRFNPNERASIKEVVEVLNYPDLSTTPTYAEWFYRTVRRCRSTLEDPTSVYVLEEIQSKYEEIVEYSTQKFNKRIPEIVQNLKCPKEFLNVLLNFFAYMKCISNNYIYNYDEMWGVWNEADEMIELWFQDLGVCVFVEEVEESTETSLDKRVGISILVRKRPKGGLITFYDFAPGKEREALAFLTTVQEYCRQCANNNEDRQELTLKQLYEHSLRE